MRIISLLLCSAVGAAGCFDQRYCSKLVTTAKTPAVQEAARILAKSFDARDVSIRKTRSDDGVGPGLRWIGQEIDNELFGFGDRGHVRLVGPSPIDERDNTIGQSVDSLMFTERSRTGILVRLPMKTDFGDPSETVTPSP